MTTLPRPRPARRSGYTLAEMLVACGVFALATLGIWECIRTVLFLSAKNTGLNVSHSALQTGLDRLSNQITSSLQVIDVATFDGTTFTHVDEASAAGTSAAGNAVRFLRVLPVTLFVLPDDGSGYSMTNYQTPTSLQYPDYLTVGNHNVNVTFNTAASNLTDPAFLADAASARFFPRFPYLTEPITTGSCPGTMPGMDLVGSPVVTGTNTAALFLVNGLPNGTKTGKSSVPSCNQAFLVIVSAAAVLNRGTAYSELLYYPDATNVARSSSLCTGLSVSTSGGGPLAFALPKNAGALSDPSARGSLQVTLPIYAPNLNNSVVRRGGTAALTTIAMSLPVETRRRAQY